MQFLCLEPGVLLRPLLPLLTSGNEEAVVEAARAVSNLARGSADVQDALLHGAAASAGDTDSQAAASVYEEIAADSAYNVADGYSQQSTVSSSSSSFNLPVGQYVLKALVLLLAHSSWEVVYNVAGALLNLTAATGSAAALHEVSADTTTGVCRVPAAGSGHERQGGSRYLNLVLPACSTALPPYYQTICIAACCILSAYGTCGLRELGGPRIIC